MPATQINRARLKDTHDLESYREKVATSLQVVVAKPKEGSPDTLYVDLDIDKSNPNYDAYRFMLHVGDVINSKKTNHLKLRDKLDVSDTGGASSTTRRSKRNAWMCREVLYWIGE